MELLSAVGLAEENDTVAVELPYGRKRALEIATTLAMDPELLLLDEPTSGMGREDVDRTTDLIQRVSADRTTLLIEHNLSVVAKLAEVITVLSHGVILAEGDYSAVSEHAGVKEAYLGTSHG
jgi:branched-chain amino acid transport system ATP-binding protein